MKYFCKEPSEFSPIVVTLIIEDRAELVAWIHTLEIMTEIKQKNIALLQPRALLDKLVPIYYKLNQT
jgi:hypothetical protein